VKRVCLAPKACEWAHPGKPKLAKLMPKEEMTSLLSMIFSIHFLVGDVNQYTTLLSLSQPRVFTSHKCVLSRKQGI